MINRIFLFCFVFSFFSFSFLFANEEVNSVLERAAEAFSEEDCMQYADFFVENIRQKKRREAGLFFASNSVKLILNEVHIIYEDESKVEAAISYSRVGPDFENKYSAIMLLKKENDDWKIEREFATKSLNQEQSYAVVYQDQSLIDLSNLSNCASGQCSTTIPAQKKSGCVGGKCSGPDIPFNTLKMCRDYGFNPIPCPGR